jgi:hypothetical protein
MCFQPPEQSLGCPLADVLARIGKRLASRTPRELSQGVFPFLRDDRRVVHDLPQFNASLTPNAGKGANGKVLLGMRNCDDSWLRRMCKMMMGASPPDQSPAIALEDTNDFGRGHAL